MDNDNVEYLKTIAAKANYYHQTRNKSIEYITENNLLTNKELCVSIFLVGAVWAASKLNQVINDDELEIFFGLKGNDDEDRLSDMLVLLPEHAELTLRELQDKTVESFN